jgi:fibronectin-binding autotransporter adhesin
MKKQYSNQSSKQSTKKSAPVNQKQARKPLISALEPRLLLDGAAVATAVDVLTDSQFHDAFQTDASQQDTDASAVIAPTEVRAADPTLNNGKKEVVFIEDNVADYQTLIDGIGAGIEVVLLDSTQDGLAQMALWAESNSDYDAIHIISHGAEGQVNLGGFSLDNITVNTRSADLAQLGAALNEDGDLLLYGCEVATGEGQEFITALAQATQADVAASDDLTGAANLEGDWVLENTVGNVESATLEASDYSGVLTTVGSSVAIWAGGSEAIAATSVGAGVEHDLSGGNNNLLFDVDATNSTITITYSNFFAMSISSFDAVFSGGTLDQFTSITRTGGTSPIAEDVSATFSGKTITFNVPVDQSGDGTIIFAFTSTAIGGNNAPTITGAPTDITVTEDTASNINLSGVTFADSDGDNLTVTLTASAGTLTATSGGSVTVSNSGTGTLTLSGTAANINTYLDTTTNIQYTGASNASGDNAATLTIKANDSTVDSSTSTVNIDITAVNDAPTAVSPTTGTVSTFDSANAVVATVGATDVDDTTLKYSIQSISLDSASQANDGSLFNFATDANTLVATNALRATTPSGLTAGTYIVTVVATDAEGLSKTQEITITVTDTLVVTTANDTSEDAADAYNGNSYAAELADGGGLSLREALGLAAAGGKTIAFAAGLNSRDISLDSEVTVADGTVFQLANGTSFTISGSNLLLNGGLTINNAASNNLTLSANLTDNGVVESSLTKAGAGILILGGTNNTVTGGDTGTGLNTIVASDGRLQISADTNLGTDGVTLSGGVTFATAGNTFTLTNTFAIEEGGASFNQTGSGHLTLSNQVAGSGLLTKTGGGSMTLSENNDALDGGIKITSGTLNAKASVKSLGNETVTLDGGTLAFSDAGTVGNNITVSAAATISNSTNVILSGQISGSGVLTKAGAGTMTWSGTNTHSGDLIVSTGALAVSGGSSIGDDSAVTVSSGATLSLTGGNETIGSLSGSGAVALTYGLTVGNASSTEFSGAISSTTTSGITKVGTGKLTLSGENNYTGTTTVSAGTLSISRDSNLGSGQLILNGGILNLNTFSSTLDNAIVLGASVGIVSVTNGGTAVISGVISGDGNLSKTGAVNLTLSGNNTYTGTTSISGVGGLSITGDSNLGSGQVILQSDNTVLTITGATTIDNAILFNNQNATISAANAVTLNGVITGTGALTKSGAGVLTLSGNNADYSGDIFLSQGVIIAAHNNALGNTAGSTTVSSGSTLRVGNSLTLAENLTISGVGIDPAYGALKINEGTGSATVTGDITLAANSLIGAFNADDSLTLSGVISGGFGLTKVGSGTLTLTGDNTYTGVTTVSAGTLVAGSDTALGTIASATTVNSGAALELGNGVDVAEAVSIAGVGGLKLNTGSATLSGNLTLTADARVTVGTNATLTSSGTWTGAYTAYKMGAGNLVLNGTNSGATTTNLSVSSGNLYITDESNLVGGTLTLNTGSSGSLTVTGSDVTISKAIALGVSGGRIVNANALSMSGVISGTGALTKAGAGRLALSGTNTFSGSLSVTDGTLAFGANNNISSTSGLTLDGGTLASTATVTYAKAITLGANGGTLNLSSGSMTLSGVISGSGRLTSTSTNAGTALTLSGINTYTGGTTLNSGILQFNNDNAIGSGTLTIEGGKVRAGIASRTISNDLVLGGTLTMSGSNALTFTGGVDLGGADRTIDNSITSNLTFSGVMSNGSLTIAGSAGTGAVILSGTNTHTNTTISGGNTTTNSNSLSIASDANLGTGTLTLNGAGAVLNITGAATTIDNAIAIGSSGGTVNNTNAVTLSGVISGAGALTKSGVGTMTLSATNTHTGNVTVSAGTMEVSGGSSIGDDSAVTVSSGATLSLIGGNETIGSLSGSGAVALTYGLTVGNASNTVFSGVISSTNTSGITKVGSGTLALSGANTYTGATTVSAGKLLLQGGSAIADSSAVTISSGAELELRDNDEAVGSVAGAGTLTLNGGTLTVGGNNNSTTFSGVIQDSGGLTKIGTGTLTLSGSNTYAGATDVLAGGLSITGDSNLGSGALTLNSGTLSVTGDGANIDNAISLSFNGGVVNVGAGITATLSGVVSGPGDLTKAGVGVLTLTGSNAYTGTTTVSAGTLVVDNDAALGTADGDTVVESGATLQATAGISIADALTLSGTGVNGAGALVASGNGTVTASGAITLGAATTVAASDADTILSLSNNIAGTYGLTKVGAGMLSLGGNSQSFTTLTIGAGSLSAGLDANLGSDAVILEDGTLWSIANNGGTIDNAIVLNGSAVLSASLNTTLAGGISGSGSLTKQSNGTLTLSGSNSYTGTTTITGGTLAIGGDGNLGAGSLAMNGGTLSVTGSSVTIDNAISLGNNGGTVSNANAVTLSGLVSGTGALTKLASGILTLSNTGNEAAWSGGINVSAGTLAVIDDNVLSSGALNVTGGTLELGNSVNLDNAVTLGAGGVLLPASGKTATLSGNLALTSDATFNLGVNTNLTISGVVSGDYGITKSGSASLHLTGNNTYTGATVINAGLVTAGTNTALGATESGTTVNSGGTLSFANGVSIAENLTIAGTGSLSNGALVMRSSGTATLTGAVTLSGDATVKASSSAYTLVLAGVISDGNNGYTLTKDGTGTVTLSGTNTYTGATNVSAGTLLVTGALNGTSSVTVSSGATLGASGNGNTGTIFAANSSNTVTVQSGGTLSPGLTSSVGLMTINGNLDLQSGSTLRVDIAGTTAGSLYDVVDVRGSVSLAGALTVNHNYTPGNGDTYRIITNDSADAITGTFTGLAEAGTLTAGGNATVLTGYYAASDVAATTGGNDFMLRAPVNSPPTLTAGTATATLVEAGGMNNGTAGTNSASITLTKADADGTASYDTDYLINNGWSTIDSGATYTKIGVYGSASLNIATDVVSYMLNNSDSVTDALTSEQSVSDSFSVQVTDGIDTQSANVVFNITGANDTPVITSGTTGNVNENAATSTVIYTAIATDVDTNDSVTYSLTGDDAALLDINATTGEVTLKASADFETKASYSFNVVATDNGTGNLTDTQAVTVSVNDLNDNAPVITSGVTASVDENADLSTVVYTATATDADVTNANKTISFSLTGTDAAAFDIDSSTGVVTLKASADYETKASYSFSVVATDNGTGNLTDTQAVTVSVNDLNDNAPVITSGATASIDENADLSTVVYTATATDADGTNGNKTISFSLTGTDAAAFDIDSNTGEVTLKASADFETKSSYSFTVVATDNGTGNLTDTQAVTVSVNDLNDHAPVITSGATASIDENAATSTVVYTATATDADGTNANKTISFSLTGTDAAAFDIDSSTGVVTLKASADYETKASYSFSVVAIDNGMGSLIDTQAVVVSINDMNEAPVMTSGAAGNVNENAATNTVIYTAVATDVDTNDSVTYSLTGDDAALLDINATTGEVTLKASANYETKASYRFNVVATDSGTGNLTDTQAVVVSINDVNETPVMTSGATGSVNENANVATVIYTATATDVDANDSVTYSLTGDDAALLDINAATGEVTLKASADYETKASYSFNVVATDNGASNFNSGNLSVSQAVVVSVNDLNDNAPTVSAGAATATLVEAGGANNTNAGTNSATITLTKGDVDTVGVVRYDADFLANGGWMTTDNGETYSRTGDYGTAIITTSTDVIRYVLNNNATNTQSLTSGQSVTDSFTIQITDGNATAITTAVFEIDGANDTPIVSGTVANMSGTSGQIFTPVTLPANLFSDRDANDQLVWSVENLPTGLVFNAATRTISGTPRGGFEGVNTLQVVATDIDGAQVRVPVTLTLNPAPVFVSASPVVDVAPVVPIQNTGFTAPDVTTTSSALPTGVVETSGGSRGFTEVAASAGVSQAQPVVEAPVNNAPNAGQAAGSNTVVVSESRVAVNVGADGRVQVSEASGVSTNTTGLTVATIVPQGERVSITIADTSTVARYSGTLADGTQLPDWVEINPTTGEVTMTPPPGQGTITLKVNAVDADGNVRILEIEVDLESLPQTAPADTVTNVSSVFMSLDDQLAVAAEQYDDYGSGLMKLLAS